MNNCNNCYGGCTEIVSDRCVKYTGIDIPELGILTGDTLSSVEQSITTYLVSVLDGSGVKIDLSSINICALVQSYLPICSTCTDISIADIAKALIQAACDLQTQVDAVVAELAILNGDYTIGCLTGVTASSNTHAIVQAVITKLCQLNVAFDLLLTNLPNTYVKLNQLDILIQEYLDSLNIFSNYYNRMVPYTVVEYYGLLSGPGTPNFDGTGAGTGDWDKIYLCNGENGTPDKRGVIGVGTTDGSMGGLTLPTRTNPSTAGNPSYALNVAYGNNTTTLGIGQIPDHTHAATVTVVDPGHKHIEGFGGINSTASYGVTAAPVISNINSQSGTGTANHAFTSTEKTGLDTVGAITVVNTHVGSGNAHTNIQPVLPCYYIIYIP